MAFRFAYLVLASMIIEQQFYLLRISVDQIIGIDHCISHFFTLTTTEFLISLFLKTLFLEKLKMPSYSNIFQPETSFRTQIVDLENEDKKSA